MASLDCLYRRGSDSCVRYTSRCVFHIKGLMVNMSCIPLLEGLQDPASLYQLPSRIDKMRKMYCYYAKAGP